MSSYESNLCIVIRLGLYMQGLQLMGSTGCDILLVKNRALHPVGETECGCVAVVPGYLA